MPTQSRIALRDGLAIDELLTEEERLARDTVRAVKSLPFPC